jgi:hypothetical protein
VITDTATVEVGKVVNLDFFSKFYIRGYLFQNKFTTFGTQTLNARTQGT